MTEPLRLISTEDYKKECWYCGEEKRPALSIFVTNKPIVEFCEECTLDLYNNIVDYLNPIYEGEEE